MYASPWISLENFDGFQDDCVQTIGQWLYASPGTWVLVCQFRSRRLRTVAVCQSRCLFASSDMEARNSGCMPGLGNCVPVQILEQEDSGQGLTRPQTREIQDSGCMPVQGNCKLVRNSENWVGLYCIYFFFLVQETSGCMPGSKGN